MNTTQASRRILVRDGDPPVSVGRVTWKDMPTVASMIRSSADWYREIVDEKDMGEHEVGEQWMVDNYRRRTFYLGYLGDDAFGTISLQTFGEFAYIGYVYLDVDFVGKGLGHVLMNFAAERAREQELAGLALIAHPEATWATRAYEKFGFEKIASSKEDVLAWQDGILEGYYEEAFELYTLPFAGSDVGLARNEKTRSLETTEVS